MTTKPSGPFAGLTESFKNRKIATKSNKKQRVAKLVNASDAPIKLMKVSHAMTLLYIALLLAFSIVAVQNNRIRKAHTELLEAHDALYLETQVMRLEASAITSPMSIRTWAKNQGMVPYYSSEMELEQLEPNYFQADRQSNNQVENLDTSILETGGQ